MRNKSWGRLMSLVLSAALVFSGSGLQALAAEEYAVTESTAAEEITAAESEAAAGEETGSSEASVAEDGGIVSDAESAAEAVNEDASGEEVTAPEEEVSRGSENDPSDENTENAGSKDQTETEVLSDDNAAAKEQSVPIEDEEALLETEDAASAEDSIEPEVISDEDDPLFGVPIGEDEYYVVFVADESTDEDLSKWNGKYSFGSIGSYGYGHVDAVAVGESVFLTGDEFVKKTRKLTGWSYNVNGGTWKSLGTKATVDSSKLGAKAGDIVVLKAKWSASEVEYKLKLVTNGGTVKSGELRDKYKYSAPYTLPVMEKKGWTFWGWAKYNWSGADDSDEGDKFTIVGQGADVKYDRNDGEFGDYTLYAVYNRSYYKASFNTNGGTINISGAVNSIPYDASYSWSGVTYSRPGYKIKHWEYEADDGSIKTIPASSKVVLKNLSAEGRTVEVKAIWIPLTYTITYSLGSGAKLDSSAPKKYDSGSSITLTAPTRTGYYFDGWELSMKDKKAPITASITESGTLSEESYGNIVLTARWTEIDTYEFKFVDGSEAVEGFDSIPAMAYTGTYDFTFIAQSMSSVAAYADKGLSVKGFALKATDTKPKYKLNTSYKMADIVKNAGANIEGLVITLYVITEPKKGF